VIRALHVANSLNRGGAEGMLARVALGLDPARFEVVVVTLLPGGALRPRLEAAGLRVVDLGMRRGRPSARGFARLVGLLREHAPDVVSTWLYHADLAASLALRAAYPRGPRPALVWNLRCSRMDMEHYRRTSGWTRGALARLSGRLPDAVTVNASASRSYHEELGYRPRRWELIPNGVDPERFGPDPGARTWLRETLGLPGEARVVSHTGRFDPMKDHVTLLRASARVFAAEPGAHLVLTGQGLAPDDPELAALIRREAPGGRVHVLGDRDDLPRVLAGADVSCLSSIGEAFPNVVAESMACGTPAVVTDVGDCAAIVAETGRVVPPRDPGALAAALLELLGEPQASAQARREAARARVVREYPLARAVERFAGLYEELARTRGAR
jgi:glycosyltransferase involved in cell wall biosynthesis